MLSPDRVAVSIVKAIEKKRKRSIIDCRWRLINFFLKHFQYRVSWHLGESVQPGFQTHRIRGV